MLATSEDEPGPEFHLANRFWGSSLLPSSYYQKDFLAFLAETYAAPFETLDFSNELHARKMINKWVSKRTRKRIPELIPEKVLDASTIMVLVNAIYFKSSHRPRQSMSSSTGGGMYRAFCNVQPGDPELQRGHVVGDLAKIVGAANHTHPRVMCPALAAPPEWRRPHHHRMRNW